MVPFIFLRRRFKFSKYPLLIRSPDLRRAGYNAFRVLFLLPLTDAGTCTDLLHEEGVSDLEACSPRGLQPYNLTILRFKLSDLSNRDIAMDSHRRFEKS